MSMSLRGSHTQKHSCICRFEVSASEAQRWHKTYLHFLDSRTPNWLLKYWFDTCQLLKTPASHGQEAINIYYIIWCHMLSNIGNYYPSVLTNLCNQPTPTESHWCPTAHAQQTSWGASPWSDNLVKLHVVPNCASNPLSTSHLRLQPPLRKKMEEDHLKGIPKK